MVKGEFQETKTREQLIYLNSEFHNKELLNESFYKQLSQAECEYEKCILITITPDGNNTFFGALIRQDGKVLAFDLDLDYPKFSEWNDITSDFMAIVKQCSSRKAWKKEVVAKVLFNDLRSISGSK